MAAVLSTFTNAFSWMKIFELLQDFIEIYCQCSNWQYASIGLDNSSPPRIWRAIICSNDDPILWRKNASSSLKDLRRIGSDM